MIGLALNQNPLVEGKQHSQKWKFPCKICQEDHIAHHYPFMEDVHKIMVQHGGKQQPIILMQPFPHHQ